MKSLILMICLLLSFPGCSQIEKQADISGRFQSHYNNADYRSVYAMFDSGLRALVSEKQTVELLQNVRSDFGTIQNMEVSEKENNTLVCRTTFERTTTDIYLASNAKQQITGFFIPRNRFENASVLKRNSTKMIFPFKEEAFVYWGGETTDLNYHMADFNQQYAYDILMVADGAPFKGDPTKNESYFVFGKEILAPCDAKVVSVIDSIADNVPGELNTSELTGNTLVLETQRKEYLLFGHLKANSIQVREGDWVKQGQVIAQCGNSGNSTQAHLHLQLQNTPDLFNCIGAKLYFDAVIVNGTPKRDYMPRKEDFVRNE